MSRATIESNEADVAAPQDAWSELDPLLAPLPGDHPAGDSTAYAYYLRREIEELRREELPEDFDDATRPPELKRADWNAVIERSTKALCEEAKDLRIACHLIEAWARTESFTGVHRGLALLTRMVEECWDRVLPDIDDGDLDARGAPLANMLDDPMRGIRFPNTVRQLPLFSSGKTALSFQEWKQAQGDGDSKAAEQANRILASADPEQLHTTLTLLSKCVSQVDALVPALDERLHEASPGFTYLRQALVECQQMLQQELARVGGGQPHTTEEQPEAATADGPAIQTTISAEITSRYDAYRQLTRIADMLQKLEPHSPVPLMVKRAVRLGRLPFPQLMEKLVRDSNVLAELNREVGADEDEDSAG